MARFAAFFHCPLFAPSCTSRELNAVDSEHKKNHQNDIWRIFQINKHLSKPGHVWRKFGSGNRESLTQAAKDLKAKGKLEASSAPSLAPSPISSRIASPAPSVSSGTGDSDADGGAIGRETRRRLVEWWSKEYCASRMHLCVLGQGNQFACLLRNLLIILQFTESLDDLAEMVASLFSPIANRGIDPLPMISEQPVGPNESGVCLISVNVVFTADLLRRLLYQCRQS